MVAQGPEAQCGPCAKGVPTGFVAKDAGFRPNCHPAGCFSPGQWAMGKGSGSWSSGSLSPALCPPSLTLPLSGPTLPAFCFSHPRLTHLCPLTAYFLTLGFPSHSLTTILPLPRWKVFWGQQKQSLESLSHTLEITQKAAGPILGHESPWKAG